MPPLAWSFLLSSMGLLGLWLLGRQNPNGWLITLADQVLWTWYALDTGQLPFVATAFAYALVAVRGLRKWRRESRAVATLRLWRRPKVTQ